MVGINRGVIFPLGLWTISTFALEADIVFNFSPAKAFDETTMKRYPLIAQTKASEDPVLPPVASTTVMPGLNLLRRSASSMTDLAMQSL